MIARIKHLLTEKGFIITLLLSVACLIFFYGKLLEHPNSTYFTDNGDGFQSYYSAIYHVKHDSSFWKMDGMNYPYGEQIFFTGAHPFITNIIKSISVVVDISDYTVAIINLVMLLSILLCALSVYLIFKHLKLPFLYSAIVATALAFLSPQLDRLNGHFSLTYQFAIPMLLLLLLKFHKVPSTKKSLLIGTLTFFMAGTQFYFFGFFAVIQGCFWLMTFLSNGKTLKQLQFILRHGFIQVIAPFVLIQLIVALIDSIGDRTQFPWGYLVYTSNLTGVFFPPNGRFYIPLFECFSKAEFKEWEGHAFIGLVAVVFFITVLITGLKHLLNQHYALLFKPTNNKALNSFLLAGLISLLIAFGFPFIIKGCESWLHYTGPLKQLRAIGRFTWPFYYIINIIAFYRLYEWLTTKKVVVKYVIYTLALFFVSYDAFIKSYERQDSINHTIDELHDPENKLPNNQWLNTIKPDDYQAIISLPYFHIGSENIMITTESNIIKYAFIASIQTGLPLVPITLSRTSLNQTYKNVQLIKEPYRPLELINDFKNAKPFLVLVRENELNDDEKRLLTKCKKIQQTPLFDMYELEVNTLKHLHDHLYEDAKKQLAETKTFTFDQFQSTDSLKTFFYDGYDEMKDSVNYMGQGSYKVKVIDHTSLYRATLPLWTDQEYMLSFWVNNFTTDLYPRSIVEMSFLDSTDVVYHAEYFNFGNSFSVLDGNWALVERKFKLKNKSDKVSVILWNDNIIDDTKMLQIDELLIRPSNTKLFNNSSAHKIVVNNRLYLENQEK